MRMDYGRHEEAAEFHLGMNLGLDLTIEVSQRDRGRFPLSVKDNIRAHHKLKLRGR